MSRSNLIEPPLFGIGLLYPPILKISIGGEILRSCDIYLAIGRRCLNYVGTVDEDNKKFHLIDCFSELRTIGPCSVARMGHVYVNRVRVSEESQYLISSPHNAALLALMTLLDQGWDLQAISAALQRLKLYC